MFHRSCQRFVAPQVHKLNDEIDDKNLPLSFLIFENVLLLKKNLVNTSYCSRLLQLCHINSYKYLKNSLFVNCNSKIMYFQYFFSLCFDIFYITSNDVEQLTFWRDLWMQSTLFPCLVFPLGNLRLKSVWKSSSSVGSCCPVHGSLFELKLPFCQSQGSPLAYTSKKCYSQVQVSKK